MTSTVESKETRNRMKTRIDTLKKEVQSGLPQVCLVKARLITESYRQTEAEPVVIARAKALSYVLSNIKIWIDDKELIVGNVSEVIGKRACVMEPGRMEWLEKEMDTLTERDVDKAFISEDDKKTVRELVAFWKGKTAGEKAFFLMPDDLRAQYLERMDEDRVTRLGAGGSGGIVDYERILTQGLDGVTREAEEHLQAMDLTDPVQLSKIHFYRAIIITHKAVIEFANRYTQLARELERKEKNSTRKEELREIAKVCEHVPAKPASTFHEALQSVWFVRIALQMESGSKPPLGRMDQYLFPYYKRDIEEGRLDREKAKELVQCLFIKLNSYWSLGPIQQNKYFSPAVSTGHNITLGGVGRDGMDATNELSYLMLDADGDLCLVEPETVVRFHKNMLMDFAIKTCEIAKKCRGKIKFIGDNAAIGKLLNRGHTLEEARDYAIQGCFELYVPSITSISPAESSGGIMSRGFNLLLCLELALNDGRGVLSGKQLGPHTGDAKNFKSIQDVLEAFRAQVAYFTELGARHSSVALEAAVQFSPSPLQSSLIQGCLEKGLDATAGGALYNVAWCSGSGAINTADSLAAIKKYVFDDGILTMGELLDAMHSNFEGKEDIQQALLAAPKFGNDDDYVDLLAREVASIYAEEWQKHKLYGGKRQVMAQLSGLPRIIPMGWLVGASADGRKSGESLADGGVSPVQGRNTKGPTATFRSVAKLDHFKLHNGEGLNMRFSPDALKDDRSIRKFATLVQTYLTDMGGFHCQFNIVSSEMLRDAQRNPERYQDLLVRVATYTAYFVELSPDVQNNIINWTELGLS